MANDFSNSMPAPWDPPPARPSALPRVLLALAVLGGILLLVCCGAGVLVVRLGMGVVSADIEMQLRDHPQIREHLGEIQSLQVDWAKSLAEEDYDIWTYDVEGSLASGELTVQSVTGDEGEEITAASLRLSGGQKIELDLQQQ